MILSDKYQFAFIHIPKCGGTTVRAMIQEFDSTGGRFTDRVDDHPELGKLDFVHIPLRVLRDYFPKEFALVVSYRSYALCRDPFDRFPSSLAQRIRMYKAIDPHSLGETQFARYVDEVITYLSANSAIKDPSFIHFEKQVNFVDVDRERIIKNIFPIDSLGEMLKEIEAIVDRNLGPEPRLAQTFVFRNSRLRAIAELAHAVGGGRVWSSLPELLRRPIRKPFFSPARSVMPKSLQSNYVRDFVESYYRLDFRLFEEVTKRVQTGR